MAMVPCSKCNHEISDEAVVCPACGQEVGKEAGQEAGQEARQEVEGPKENGVCIECGVALEAEAAFCSSCGCPVAKEEDAVEETAVVAEGETGAEEAPMVAGKSKKPLIIILVLALILGVVGVVVSEQQKKAKAEAMQNYYNCMVMASDAMLSGGANAENVGNMVKNVWYRVIYKVDDAETDKFTKENGQFYDDFNDALVALFTDDAFMAKLDALEEEMAGAEGFMGYLDAPPEGFEASHEAMLDYYEAYIALTEVVREPEGSLKSFAEDFEETDGELLEAYKAAEELIKEKELELNGNK